MDIFYSFKTDEALEEQGKEIEIGGGSFLTIARENNRTYKRIMRAELEAHKETLALENDESEELFIKILIKVMARSVLLGWRGTKFKGENLPYSVANAAMLLEIKDFREMVQAQSKRMANFLVKQEETDVKKSQTTSSGTTTGEAT